MPKKIVLCFDGTSNQPSDAVQGRTKSGGIEDDGITNVLKLHLLLGGGLTEPDSAGDQVSFDVSDRDAQPLVRIPPQYPPRAAERGLEGHCTMSFDVTPDGTPTNIVATECTSSLFERTSVRAVERWRYEPKIQEGTAVWRRGVVTRIDYQLEG